MTAPQIEIKQGIARTLTLDVTNYPELESGVEWIAALVNQSTKMRYVADNEEDLSENIKVFTWPSGLDNNLNLDDEHQNGTAWMTVGTYDLEIYPSDRSNIGVLYQRFRVATSNLMAKNAPQEQEQQGE